MQSPKTNLLYVVHKCHANTVANWAKENMASTWKPDLPGASSNKEAANLPLSHLVIPLVLSDKIKLHLQAEHSSCPPREFRPEQDILPVTCSCGAGWKQYNKEYHVGTYYTVSFVSSTKVFYR